MELVEPSTRVPFHPLWATLHALHGFGGKRGSLGRIIGRGKGKRKERWRRTADVCARREKPDMRTLLVQIILNALASYNRKHKVEVQIYWSQGHYISSPSVWCTVDRKILA